MLCLILLSLIKEKNIPFLIRQFQVLTGNTNYFHLIVFISQVVPKLGVINHQKKQNPYVYWLLFLNFNIWELIFPIWILEVFNLKYGLNKGNPRCTQWGILLKLLFWILIIHFLNQFIWHRVYESCFRNFSRFDIRVVSIKIRINFHIENCAQKNG